MPRNDSNQSPTHLGGFSRLWMKRPPAKLTNAFAPACDIQIDLKVSIRRIPSRGRKGDNARAGNFSEMDHVFHYGPHARTSRRDRSPRAYFLLRTRLRNPACDKSGTRRPAWRDAGASSLRHDGDIPDPPTNLFYELVMTQSAAHFFIISLT